ncbi:MAG: cupin domain-containing protein [archaeon]|nr:cupin domain-containing protein [archaeon]
MKISVKKPTEEELESLNVKSWGIWTKEASEFDWSYDTKETCYLLEGDVDVETSEGTVHFEKGDFVVFEEGLDCKWKINKAVKKHYKFG